MKRTDRFRLPYLEKGDLLYKSDELQRWRGVDSNLGMTSDVMGDGVCTGLTLAYDVDTSSVLISPGRYVSDKFWFVSGDTQSVAVAEGYNYTLYAHKYDESTVVPGVIHPDDDYTYTVTHLTFGATTGAIPAGAAELGRFSATLGIATIDETTRTQVVFGGKGLENNLQELAEHVHSGSPSKIDLSSEVTGTLPAAFMARIPGSRVNSGIIGDGLVIEGLSHVGRVKEPCSLVVKTPWMADDSYEEYRTDPWTGWAIVFVDGSPVRAGFEQETGSILLLDAISPANVITVCTDLKTVAAEKGSWDSNLAVTVYKNSLVVDPSEYTLNADDGLIVFKEPLSPDPTMLDVVEITIHGVNIVNVGSNTHDDIDYWFGENSSWLGWWPSFVTEFNLGQLAIQLRGLCTGPYQDPFLQYFSDNFYEVPDPKTPNYSQLETVILPDDWYSYVGGGYRNGGGGNRINDGVTHPPGPDGGLWTGARSQSFLATDDNVIGVQPWLGRVGDTTDYTLAATLYDSDTTDLPLLTNTLGSVYYNAGAVGLYAPLYMDFPSTIPTTIGNKYALVLSQQGGDGDSYIEWYGSTSYYPFGSGGYSTLAGQWRTYDEQPDDHWVIIWSDPGTRNTGGITGMSFSFDSGPVEHVVNPIISIIIDCSGSNLSTDENNSRFGYAKTFISNVLDYYTTGSHTGLPTDKTALFDLLVFAERDSAAFQNKNLAMYDTHSPGNVASYITKIVALLGDGSPNSVITNDQDVLYAALDTLVDGDMNNRYNAGATPIGYAIKTAAQRLKSVSIENRKKFIVLITDGMNTDDIIDDPDYVGDDSDRRKKSTAIAELIADPDDPISVNALLYQDPLYMDIDEVEQAVKYISEWTNKTSGLFYTVIDVDSLSSALTSLSSNSAWISGSQTGTLDLTKNVFVTALDLTGTIPEGASATVEIYTRVESNADGTEPAWEQVGTQPFELTDGVNTITIGKFLRYVEFRFNMVAGSVPVFPGGTIYYEDIYEDYIYSKVYETERPLQQIALSFSRVPDMMPDGVKIDFAVAPGDLTWWDSMVKLAPYDRELIPARLRESTTTEDYATYTPKYGGIAGASGVMVYINGARVPKTNYRLNPLTGAVTFTEALTAKDNVAITVDYGHKYRIGTRILHTGSVPHTTFNFSWLYTIHPLFDTIYREEPEDQTMAFTYQVISEPNYLPTSTGSAIFANSVASQKAYVRWIMLHNVTGSAYQVDLYKVPNQAGATGAAGYNNRFFSQIISASESVQIEFPVPGMVLDEQWDTLVGMCTGPNSVVVQAYGGVE